MFQFIKSPDIFRTPYHRSALWDPQSPLHDTIMETLPPKELKTASLRRKVEFAAGRWCAAKAIQSLDPKYPVSVGINTDGSPRWPEGIVGSITHAEGYVSAAVARYGDCLNLGIDSEKCAKEESAEELAAVVLRNDEEPLLLNSPLSRPQAVTLVFCAKESAYKCLYPLVKRPFEFDAFRLRGINFGTRTFRFDLTDTLSFDFPEGAGIDGRFEVGGVFIHAAVELFENRLRS